MINKRIFMKLEKWFVVTICIYLVNALVFNTFLTAKNIENQMILNEISAITRQTETMTAQIGQMRSYQSIYEVAVANGWRSNQNNVRTID